MTASVFAAQREASVRHAKAREEHLASRPAITRRPLAELERIAREAEERFADSDTETVLAWVSEEFGYSVAVACSMADAVLPHVVARHLPWVDTLFLDTGYHFAETIGTRDAVEGSLEVTIVDVTATQTVAEQDAAHGKDLFARDPGLCCQLRKVEPLRRTLSGYEAWITGVRREDAPTRANTPFVTWDSANNLVKINPLAAWTFDELLEYAARHQVTLNPLLNAGYPSIGCAPCTKPVAPGADPRSGRWAGLDKIECGLHV